MRFLRFFMEGSLTEYGYVPREKQIELAEEIFAAINDHSILLAEAAVGTGKTLAYLLPAVLARRGRLNRDKLCVTLRDGHAMPVVIATSSIALQTALINDYIPSLSRILIEKNVIKTPLTAALRKGKKHYICERRLADFIKTANAPTLAAAAPLKDPKYLDLSGLKGVSSYIKRNIQVDDQCGAGCPLYENCHYMRFTRRISAGGYDFQVVNHNLFFGRHNAQGAKEEPHNA